MGNQLEKRQIPLTPIGQVTTQEQAVLGLLGKLHSELRDVEAAVFQLVHGQALGGGDRSVALDVGKIRCVLMEANRTMKNIDELGVCCPGDAVKRDAWHWTPVNGGQ